jgi:hypothetical protein
MVIATLTRAMMRTALLLALLSVTGVTGAAAQFEQKDTLKGVRTIGVHIIGADAEAVAAGLDTARLRTAVELRVREAGLRVQEGKCDGCLDGELLVDLTVVVNKRGLIGYSYTVSLARVVTILKTDLPPVGGITWQSGGVGTTNAASLEAEVEGGVTGALERFLNNWLAVNPR